MMWCSIFEFSCSFAYSNRNVFGRNQKFNLSLERGQIDSVFRVNYTDPWIQGDNKRTSRTVMLQVILFIKCISFDVQFANPIVSSFVPEFSDTRNTSTW